MCYLGYFLLIICLFISVAFVTLFERKGLSYIQLRKGPNKTGIIGILQPISDGLKLFFKEYSCPYKSNMFLYYLSPLYLLIMSFFLWCLYPFMINLFNFNYGWLFFMCCTGSLVYGLLLAGWSSNSSYALLGSLRSLAQMISYEVSMALIMMNMFLYIFCYNMLMFYNYQKSVWFIFMLIFVFFMWIISCLAETNRAPFDFAEGESELVSGFNIEYGSGGFVYIFLSEYMGIIFMSLMTVLMFLGGDNFNNLFFCKLSLIIFWFIWVRGVLPRFRYDKLMYMSWKGLLPLSLSFFMFNINLLLFMMFN
uniref:NADH-ubiquinone oxidoreductase chain 1 n=1 Tax=Megaris sp. TaxID=2931300 RepID=A0A8T9ZWP1_9HEMI|nr:NADH dehydrogenase subunit 1 [Megaris sp.]